MKTVERKPITQSMQLQLWRKWGWVNCALCLKPSLAQRPNDDEAWCGFNWDHHLALVDGGTHTIDNLRPVCGQCHRQKSSKEHRENSKTKRIIKKAAGLTKPKAKIAGRGFDKTRTKGFDGKVRARNG